MGQETVFYHTTGSPRIEVGSHRIAASLLERFYGVVEFFPSDIFFRRVCVCVVAHVCRIVGVGRDLNFVSSYLAFP